MLFLAAVLFAAPAPQLAHPSSKCVAWRQIASCLHPQDPLAVRDTQNDKPCTEIVSSGNSGYCECEGHVKISMVGCLHGDVSCAQHCLLHTQSQVTIAAGREAMHKIVVLFAFVVFDSSKVPKLISRIRGTGRLFESYRVLVIDSTASPSADVSTWKESDDNVQVLLSDLQDETAAMNLLRTTSQDQQYSAVQYVVTVDVRVGVDWDTDGIAHSFGLHTAPSQARVNKRYEIGLFHLNEVAQWEVMCSNAIVQSQQNRFCDSSSYRDYYFRDSNFKEHDVVSHDPLDSVLQVLSCFGGLAIFSKASWDICPFHSEQSSNFIGMDNCLREAKKHILFNPRQLFYCDL